MIKTGEILQADPILLYNGIELVYLGKIKSQMSGKPNLSVLLTTHTKFEHLEFLLQSLLRFQKPEYEIILVNDDADTEAAEALRTMIRISDDERVYFFEHQSKYGRGQSLNEALLQASAPLIWAPLRADRLNESLMSDTIRRFKSDPAAFWMLDASLPDSISAWIDAAGEAELPDDSCFIWNRNVLPGGDFVFNPFLNSLTSAELALRLSSQYAWQRTDPFFVLSEEQFITASGSDLLELYLSLLRVAKSDEERLMVINSIESLKHKPTLSQLSDDLILQARQLLARGDAVKALDAVNRILRKTPAHKEANRLKITLLEKLRRHVEAAELKHSMQSGRLTVKEDEPKTDKPSPEPAEELAEPPDEFTDSETELSIIIPTTGDSQPLLEKCFAALEKAVYNIKAELIIIDNASIDNTFDYLNQLQDRNFLNCRVITNQSNRGFAASVNQGIEIAQGNNILVMHNDVVVEDDTIETLMDAVFTGIADIAGPYVSKNPDDYPDDLRNLNEVDELDSCCILFEADNNLRFDPAFELCYFETADFCRQAASRNMKLARINKARVYHSKAETVVAMGLKSEPDLKWKNARYFSEKWQEKPDYEIPEQCDPPACFEALGLPPDPWHPDEHWLKAVDMYLTSEVQTIIKKTTWKAPELYTIVTTLLFAEKRELLRYLEDEMNDKEVPEIILILLINFYFKKNIFSRCKHYLAKSGRYRNPVFDLYRLRMAVANKELDKAAQLLERLMNIYSCNPELYKLAGDIHRADGNEGEAKSFYALANQLDPFRFPAEEEAFELHR